MSVQEAKRPGAAHNSYAFSNGLVPRPALFERLELGVDRALTLVSAPAGSGKTVLVRSWLQSRASSKERAAWISIDRGERDSQRFWTTVAEQLRGATPAGATFEPLAPSPQYEGMAVVERLLADLASLKHRLIIAIDDVHEIASVKILEELNYLLTHLPSPVHLVIITRRDPQLGLHRRKLEEGLTEIRSLDLQFTLEESHQMLSALGIDLSDESLRLLHQRTEGWAAGLRLAAISLEDHADPEQFVAEFSGSERTVADYLMAEVLDAQPADIRRLLMRVSLLEAVNGPLADLLTGTTGSERHLEALADAGGFVVALDSKRTWFRFHHLYADLLAAELRHTEQDEVPRLHLIAAQWHAENGSVTRAIVHAQAAGDSDLAAGLLLEHYFSLTLDGRQESARALLDTFQPDSVASDPELAVVIAAEQLTKGSLGQACAHLTLAQRHADDVPADRRHRFQMAVLITRLSLARRIGDIRSVSEEVRAASAMVEPDSSNQIKLQNDIRTLLLMNLGIVEVWSGHVDEGLKHLTEAHELATQIGRPYVQVGCQAHMARAALSRSFVRSRRPCLDAIALAESHGWSDDPVIGPALVMLGTSHVHTGRLEEGEHCFQRAEDALHSELEPAVGFQLHFTRGASYFARGRHEEALTSYREAERLGQMLITEAPLALQLRCAILLAMIGCGELGAVRDKVAQMTGAERKTGEARDVLGALALAEGDAQEAIDKLAPTLDGTAEVHHVNVVIRSLVRDALARASLGDTLAAEGAVERALDLAEGDTLVLPFLAGGDRESLHELLKRHPPHRTSHGAFVAEILDILSERPTTREGAQPARSLDPLSDAELRVMRFLPTNLPAAAIAAEIFVSVNTVKTHMRHIYAKLGTHSRVAAVARAREIGLLARSVQHD